MTNDNDTVRVLVVDDNKAYREAFSRNLEVGGMEVLQAEHADRALELLKTDSPDVMVTDLRMRTPNEGLELIRDARQLDPILPVIMISAVGTFDEGAMASQLGATHVLSKARIEDEMSVLHDAIGQAHQQRRRNREALERIADIGKAQAAPEDIEALRGMMDSEDLDVQVRAEAFDALSALDAGGEDGASRDVIDQAMASIADVQQDQSRQVEETLRQRVPAFERLDDETRHSLSTAEYLYRNAENLGERFDLSRSTCFAYCFSVENEAKGNLRKRMSKFFGDSANLALVKRLLEQNGKQVSLFFQQQLLQTMRDHSMDFTMENVRQTYLRILEHGSKYRPDGLKALGVVLLTFGRHYQFKDMKSEVRIENPLGVKGLDEDEVVRLAELLARLQHYRNPYIHPEINEKEQLASIRETAFECLNLVMKIE